MRINHLAVSKKKLGDAHDSKKNGNIENGLNTTYSGPTSLLPELLKAPRRIASGLRGLDESITGRDDQAEMTNGERNTPAPTVITTTAVRSEFPEVEGGIRTSEYKLPE